VPLEELARTILEREADETPAQPSIDNWISQWRQWAASHPQRDVRLDDSRESIYEGRGE
jgi:accessory colonization factor AcfC